MCVLQTRSRLCQIQDNQQEASKSIEKYNNSLNGAHSGSMTNLADMSEGFSDRENGVFHSLARGAQVCISSWVSSTQSTLTRVGLIVTQCKLISGINWESVVVGGNSVSGCFVSPQQEDPFRVKPSVFNSQLLEHPSDPFHSEDPFKTDPFKGDWLCLFSVSTIRIESFPLLLLFLLEYLLSGFPWFGLVWP